jgi:hypothetical protein
MRASILVAWIILLASRAAAADRPPMIGEWGVVHAAIGCPVEEDVHRIGEMLRSGDRTAAMKMFADRCIQIPDDTEVMVEHWSTWNDTKCVRPRGDTECLWVRSGTVSAKPSQ